MNEQIKQILLQVVPMTGEDGEYLPSLHTPQDIERFAELIVRECIKSTLSLQQAAINLEWGTEATFHVIVDTIVEDLNMQHIFRC